MFLADHSYLTYYLFLDGAFANTRNCCEFSGLIMEHNGL